MYTLKTKLSSVRGIGSKLSSKLAEKELHTVEDLVLQLPLRYEDRSHFVTIDSLPENELVTLQARVDTKTQFQKNGRNIQVAQVSDKTGKIRLMWFNNRFILNNIKVGQEYLFSGKYSGKFHNITQPTVEALRGENIHSGRLVPLYSSTIPLYQGSMRRVLKNILDNLDEIDDPVATILSGGGEASKLPNSLPSFGSALTQLHFPDNAEAVALARERLALEEFLSIMKVSEKIKKEWQKQKIAVQITLKANFAKKLPIPKTLPFELTKAQLRSTREILKDLTETTPMNRLLIGDVGSGKTIVAGIASLEIIKTGHSVTFVAPTKILANQHAETLSKLLPDLPIKLVTSQNQKSGINTEINHKKPTVYIGTHKLINQMEKISPGLVIYDEQHRFGVMHRSKVNDLRNPVHILTMTATPIPRSLSLTIFSHLQVSFIDELPPGRIQPKTWLVTEAKRTSSYDWIADELAKAKGLAIFVCPFIDPSEHEAFEKVSSVKEKLKELKDYFKQKESGRCTKKRSGAQKLGGADGLGARQELGAEQKLGGTPSNRGVPLKRDAPPKRGEAPERDTTRPVSIESLHGKLDKNEQQRIIKDLYDGKIDILVTTPIVEVGVDLPQASIIVIESAERFGLASLHQLRGRVGRAGQESYCLLFTSSGNLASSSTLSGKRLREFSKINNGRKLAELDLMNRGSGELFGTTQSGFSQLHFGSWANLEMIGLAQRVYKQLPLDWKPIFKPTNAIDANNLPLAN